MPKEHTFPTLFDNALQINISNLKSWGFLNPNQTINTNLTWSRRGEQIGSVGLFVSMLENNPYMLLKYT